MVDADGDSVPGWGGVTPALPALLLPLLLAVDAVLSQVQDQPRRVGDQEHHHWANGNHEYGLGLFTLRKR